MNPMIRMQLLFFALLMMTFCSCQKGTGTVDGNVYWKYNNFVGNKPDAGADVILVPEDTTLMNLSAKCDVQGNYKFNTVPVGHYLLCIVSNNTNGSSSELFDEMNLDYVPYDKYYGVDLKELDNIEFEYCKKLSDSIRRDPSIDFDKSTEQMERFRKHWERLKSKFPAKLKLDLGFLVMKKVYVKQVEVKKDATTNNVTDFGINYL